MSSERCWGIIPAAGIGARVGGERPKQYQQIAGATLLEYSLGVLLACDWIEQVVVALHPHDRYAGDLACFKKERVATVTGGAERMDSVMAGLAALALRAAENDWVLVHDAARPCLRVEDVQHLCEFVRSSGTGAILAEPVVDTVKRVGPNHRVLETVDRSALWRAQTPQMFRLGELHDALKLAKEQAFTVTDEASAMENAGRSVHLVPGSASNIKVTVAEDLALARWYLEHQLRGAG
ncbi:MAG: 2-C-methyl-D-erythritol 4-phosphate cytidylyltransferase [Pseudomonadota bacterium]